MSPKILTLDIENAPHTARVWGYYEQNVVKIIEYGYVLMVGYKWMHEKKAKILTLDQFNPKNPRDDSALIREVWKLLDEADVVITQNGERFDIKKLNTSFIKLGLPPYSPFRSVDTKQASSRYFYFANNKLDNVGAELGLGGKMEHEGYELWEKVMARDKKAVKKMADYCKRDVELTEQVYLKQRPWIKNHPNLNIYSERPEGCPKCLSENINARGERPYSDSTVRKMWRCKDCGASIYGERVPQEKLTLK